MDICRVAFCLAHKLKAITPYSLSEHIIFIKDACKILVKLSWQPYLVVQSLSCVWLFVTPWTTAFQASLSFTISWSLLKRMSIESVMPSNYLILCLPLILLPSIFPRVRVFSSVPTIHTGWPKYWSFNFSISPSTEYSGLISFMIDWFYLLTVQGTLRSLLQYHNSKVSVLQHSAFFMVQLSHSTWLLEKPQLWLDGPLSANWCLCFLICCNMHEIWPLWGVVAGIWTTLMYLNFFLDSLLKWALSLLPHLCFGSSGNQMIGNNDRGRNIISCW